MFKSQLHPEDQHLARWLEAIDSGQSQRSGHGASSHMWMVLDHVFRDWQEVWCTENESVHLWRGVAVIPGSESGSWEWVEIAPLGGEDMCKLPFCKEIQSLLLVLAAFLLYHSGWLGVDKNRTRYWSDAMLGCQDRYCSKESLHSD